MAINDKGFIMISSLFLLSIITTIVLIQINFISTVKKMELAQHFCRTGLLQSQDQLLSGLKKLKKMNKSAKHLRKRRKSAERSLKLALSSANPTALAIAKARLSAVKAAQISFSLKQKSLIIFTNQKAKHIFTMSLLKQKNEAKKNRLAYFKYKIKTFKKLQISAKPKNSLSPSYFESKNFTDLQKISASWNWSVKWKIIKLIETISSSPTKTKEQEETLKLRFNQQCATVPKKINNTWISYLKEDKFLLNF